MIVVPLGYPRETRTRVHGYGFRRVRVRVPLENPRVACDTPYTPLINLLKMSQGIGLSMSTIRPNSLIQHPGSTRPPCPPFEYRGATIQQVNKWEGKGSI